MTVLHGSAVAAFPIAIAPINTVLITLAAVCIVHATTNRACNRGNTYANEPRVEHVRIVSRMSLTRRTGKRNTAAISAAYNN